jgi:hypothetical protein
MSSETQGKFCELCGYGFMGAYEKGRPYCSIAFSEGCPRCQAVKARIGPENFDWAVGVAVNAVVKHERDRRHV